MDINIESMVNNDSNNSMFPKQDNQDCLVPMSLLMLGQVIESKEKKIDGMNFSRVSNICRIDYL